MAELDTGQVIYYCVNLGNSDDIFLFCDKTAYYCFHTAFIYIKNNINYFLKLTFLNHKQFIFLISYHIFCS